ncbi:MAG: hypothetical protein AMXMBFR84_23580 [Candidatus Hydrogenedentota bacterium]
MLQLKTIAMARAADLGDTTMKRLRVMCAVATGALMAVSAMADATQDLLTQIKTHKFGDSRVPLIQAEAWVQSVLDNPDESRGLANLFADTLDDADATFDGKQFACRQLALIGSAEHVPALAPLLGEESTANAARFALERIPGSAVDAALLDALDETVGAVRIGIVNTLGDRRTEEAVKPLAKLVLHQDKATSDAAVAALGRIGAPAAKVLFKLRRKTSFRTDHATLVACEDLVRTGNVELARKIYRHLSNMFTLEQHDDSVAEAARIGLSGVETHLKM